jgi:hypothetical protein
MRTKRVIGVLVTLLLPLLCWFAAQSAKHAKPHMVKGRPGINSIPRTVTSAK